jgi:phosphatidylglycerol lysyltransferase
MRTFVRRSFAIRFISILVASHGILIIATTLLDQLMIRKTFHASLAAIDVPLLIGISLLYLSTLLRRRKERAWAVAVLAYTFYLGLSGFGLLNTLEDHHIRLIELVRGIGLPLGVIGLLSLFRRDFSVQSEARSYANAARISLAMVAVALLYGVVGVSLFDHSDFHREISLPQAIHFTVDQLGLTTDKPLVAYTKRAQIFVDSLSLVSIAAGVYVVIAFFEPLRLRHSDQTGSRRHMQDLLEQYGAPSEDFFKLWPHDKQYYFDHTTTSGLAYSVHRGVAVCLGDPTGNHRQFPQLIDEFQKTCFRNDWLPAWIHIQESNHALFEARDYTLQKLGEEAVVDLEAFAEVAKSKYFRQINNKFTKHGFTAELLMPPHHQAVKDRLRQVSDDWLSQGGRSERGFVMGYHSDEYIDQCPVMVVRDAASTIQAFLNQVPATFDIEEATYDMLRYADGSAGNINDFLLLNFIGYAREQGFKRLNLGLCPLVGLEDDTEDNKSLPDTVMRFAYANGDRFYSFSGLHRFKAKYEPQWRDRYVAYKGGVRGFTRTFNALLQVTRIKH